jgi:hypothetical protein
MIYADSSFLCSLYGWDSNTQTAQATYAGDARRPLILTPWQRFELRNTIRLAAYKLKRGGLAVPFQAGNVFKRIEQDLAEGRLKHMESAWQDTLRLAEELSDKYTAALGAAAVDLWHVAAAILLRADTFWTFDEDQYALAHAVQRFRRVPRL